MLEEVEGEVEEGGFEGVGEGEGVYGMLIRTWRFFFVWSLGEGGRDKRTSKSLSSANLASRIVVCGGKESVDMAYDEMSLSREDKAGEWVMRWMER